MSLFYLEWDMFAILWFFCLASTSTLELLLTLVVYFCPLIVTAKKLCGISCTTTTVVSEVQDYYYTYRVLFYSYSLVAGKKKAKKSLFPYKHMILGLYIRIIIGRGTYVAT